MRVGTGRRQGHSAGEPVRRKGFKGTMLETRIIREPLCRGSKGVALEGVICSVSQDVQGHGAGGVGLSTLMHYRQ